MARGGYGHGSGVPLHERVRQTGSEPLAPREDSFAGPAPPDAAPSDAAPSDAAPSDAGPADAAPTDAVAPGGCPARHCWVTVPVDGPAARPGLLLEWRRGDRGRWEGRVAYAAELRPGRWASVEEWIPAELLSAG